MEAQLQFVSDAIMAFAYALTVRYHYVFIALCRIRKHADMPSRKSKTLEMILQLIRYSCNCKQSLKDVTASVTYYAKLFPFLVCKKPGLRVSDNVQHIHDAG